jgi:hypothetical protein
MWLLVAANVGGDPSGSGIWNGYWCGCPASSFTSVASSTCCATSVCFMLSGVSVRRRSSCTRTVLPLTDSCGLIVSTPVICSPGRSTRVESWSSPIGTSCDFARGGEAAQCAY